ncbi:MAG: helicase-related protein [Thermodesulfobacteriota bacterium]
MTIPDIIDNSIPEKKLANVLNEVITPGVNVFIASGYFNLGGFKLIKDSLNSAKEVSILLGRALSPHDIRPPELFIEELRQEAEENMDSPEAKKSIHDFLKWLEKPDVQIKIYKKHFYHGKFYIIEGIPIIGSIAISGSSNFTEAGLTHNTEFNMVQKQQVAVNEVKKKFEELWNESEDYKEELKSLYSDFTAHYTPYEVYLKTLYAYFEDKFAEVSPSDEIPSPIILADFQRDGYLTALQAIDRYGGVLLSDSVGLGKTYLALRILDDFAYRLRQKALIICPAQLKDILWEPKLRDTGIRADIVHRERVSRDFPVENYVDYDLIVVDESHNFRNSQTNCWKNLFSTVIQGKPKKIVLITATPVNNNVFDLYNQLRLITKDSDDFFKSAGITSLWGYFLKADRDKDTLYDLLEEIAVRRSRPFIRKYYPSAKIDGEPIRFPERKLNIIRYNLDDTYQGIYEECSRTIENLILASYNIESYRKETKGLQLDIFNGLKETLLSKGWKEKDVNDYLMKLGRNESVIGILKVLLLKRLESSIEAFKLSLKRLIDFQKMFLEVFDKGRLLDREIYRKYFQGFETDECDEEEKTFEFDLETLPKINLADYETDKIRSCVKKDIEALTNIYWKVESISPKQDAKLQALIEELKRLKGKKVIIFGYFKDTMRYLYRYLGGNREWLLTEADEAERKDIDKFLREIGLPSEKISITDSEIKPFERKDRIIRFSPISNNRPELKGTEKEIEILLSTDVLSEGQNLQDANTVINYDLPWNPVRLVQRIGRIDRLKSPHDFIYLYNFFPEDALESILGILQRLYTKLEAINLSVGLDASILGETPNPKDFGYIRDLFAGKEEILEELEGISELAIGEFLKEELLEYLKEIGEDRIRRIPNGVGSGFRKEGQHGLFASFKDRERHYWCYYDLNTGKISENKLEVIRLIRCKKEEPRIELDFDPFEIINKIKDHILGRLRTMTLKPPKLKSPQNQIVNWLQVLGNKVSDLLEYFSNPLPDIYLRDLRKLWSNRALSEEALIIMLREFKNNHPVTIVEKPTSVLAEPELKLVSFIGLMSY